MNADGGGVAAAIAYLVTASNQTVDRTVFTCDATAVRGCLAAPLSLGARRTRCTWNSMAREFGNATSVQCFAGGQSAPVVYAGPAESYPELDAVTISIPRSLAGAGDVRVYVVADGVTSNVVGLNVQ